jgi:F-type H+-transporting ATPase subunit b
VQIDWVTVSAQIVNFLVLIWLLQRVLYRPLARALKAREAEVGRSLREAETARAEADAEAQAHRDALQQMEEARDARLEAVEEEAEILKAEMTVKARDELAVRRAAWQAQLEDEKIAFLDRLRRRASEAFVTLARRALSEMADEDLVDRVARVFARRLSALGADELQQLKSAAGHGETPLVLSSFPLSPEARTLVAGAIGRVLHKDVDIDFREEAELECGIVLAIGSRHVGWTLGEHLDALEADVAALLEARVTPGDET